MSFNPFNSGNVIDQVTGQADDGQNGKPIQDPLRVGDFDTFGGDVVNSKDNEVATLKVDADTKRRWGIGTAENPTNQGYIYVDLQSGNNNPMEGKIKFYVESATRNTQEFVASFDTEKLDASKTNREQMVPFPLQRSVIASEDSYVTVYLNPDSSNADTDVDSSNSEVIIPSTVYDLGF